jgi:hypothetical protein
MVMTAYRLLITAIDPSLTVYTLSSAEINGSISQLVSDGRNNCTHAVEHIIKCTENFMGEIIASIAG